MEYHWLSLQEYCGENIRSRAMLDSFFLCYLLLALAWLCTGKYKSFFIFILLFYAKFKEKIHRFSGVKRYFVSLILTTLAATITSIPLTLYFFGSGTWIGLLSNLFVIPMLFLIVLASWLSLLLPALASIFNQSVYILIEIILIGLRGLSALPVTVWQADEVPAMALFAWYGSCAYLLLLARRRTDWIIGIMMAAGALIFIF